MKQTREVLVFLILAFTFLTFNLWIFGSISVSAIKSLSGHCGKHFAAEFYVVYGDLFCPEEE